MGIKEIDGYDELIISVCFLADVERNRIKNRNTYGIERIETGKSLGIF